jgi:hypothetical protein
MLLGRFVRGENRVSGQVSPHPQPLSLWGSLADSFAERFM